MVPQHKQILVRLCQVIFPEDSETGPLQERYQAYIDYFETTERYAENKRFIEIGLNSLAHSDIQLACDTAVMKILMDQLSKQPAFYYFFKLIQSLVLEAVFSASYTQSSANNITSWLKYRGNLRV